MSIEDSDSESEDGWHDYDNITDTSDKEEQQVESIGKYTRNTIMNKNYHKKDKRNHPGIDGLSM